MLSLVGAGATHGTVLELFEPLRNPWASPPHQHFFHKYLESLAEGNLPVRRLLPLLRTLQKYKIPFIVENPATSNVWHVPGIRALLQSAQAEFVVVDQCFWGTPWRKRTGLLCSDCDSSDTYALSLCRCHGRRVCDFTGKPHVQLTGSDPSGRPMTARAQTFPKKFSTRLANLLTHKAMTRRSTS